MNPGERLHKYTILRELGRGGMGGVYVAEEDQTRHQFAIKTLFKRFTQDEAYVRRFQREAQVYRQFDLPNIVRHIESGFDDGTYFIVLEFVRGQTLAQILAAQKRLEPASALKIAIALTEALKHAHGKGVIHRDLKPSNVVLDESGEVKLLDFGVAHKKEDPLVQAKEGTVVGTHFYAAPEQNQGHIDVDPRTDLYTLGIVLYEMLVGLRPFDGDLREVTANQSRESYIPLEEALLGVPNFLPPIVKRLMKKSPEDRYQSAQELLEDLRPALTVLTSNRVTAALPVSPPPSISPPPSSIPPVSETPQAAPAPQAASQKFSAVSFNVSPPSREAVITEVAPTAVTPPQDMSTLSIPPPVSSTAAMGQGQGQNDTRWHAAKEAFQKRQLDQAQTLCEAVLVSAPQFAAGYAFLGKILSAKGHTYNSIEAFKNALALAPNDVSMHMDQAMALYTMKLPEKAIQAFEEVLRLDSKNALAARYLDLLTRSEQPSQSPVAPAAVPPSVYSATPPPPAPVSGGSLYGDVYQPPGAAPAPTPAAPPPGGEGNSQAVMNRLENFFSVPPPKPSAESPAPVASVAPPSPSSSVQVPVPVHRLGTPAQAPAVPQSIPPPQSIPTIAPIPSQASIPPPVALQIPTIRSQPAPPKRTPNYIPPPKPKEDEADDPTSEETGGPGDASRFALKKKHRRKEEEKGLALNPDQAWLYGTLWWGMGAAYIGDRKKAFFLTLLEIFILTIILAPFFSEDIAVRLQSGNFSLLPPADWLAKKGILPIRSSLYQWIFQLNKSWSPAVNDFLTRHGTDLFMGIGAAIFLWMELSLPNEFLKEAQYASLTGKIIEVRRDMTLKISLGSDQGVEEGMIFRVEKRKHVDSLSQLNFKTLMVPPEVFPIGRARVSSTTPTFAICQFKRLPGQSSSPSSGDRVAIMRE